MRARPLPEPISRGAFHIDEARAIGVHPERLRRSDLVTPTRSLRWRRDDEPIGVERIRAHRSLLRPGQFVSHTSAAALWDLPLPRHLRHESDVHIASVRPAAPMRRPGVVGHRVPPGSERVLDRSGVPVASPATAWVQCGSVLSVDELVVLGDAIVTSAICGEGTDDLAAALAARPRSTGAARLRAALPLVRVGAGSPMETLVRLRVLRGGLPEPELQVEVVDERGRFVGRADMAYREERVVVEYEGDQHRTDPDQWAKDIRRYRAFERLGWMTFRVTRYDLASDGPIAELADALRRRRVPR